MDGKKIRNKRRGESVTAGTRANCREDGMISSIIMKMRKRGSQPQIGARPNITGWGEGSESTFARRPYITLRVIA